MGALSCPLPDAPGHTGCCPAVASLLGSLLDGARVTCCWMPIWEQGAMAGVPWPGRRGQGPAQFFTLDLNHMLSSNHIPDLRFRGSLSPL